MDLDSKPDYFMADDPEPSDDAVQKPVIQFGCEQKEAAAEGCGESEPRRRRRHPMRRMILWSVLFVLLALGIGFWVRYLNPYETDMNEVGYVVDLKKQGVIFKTWEGQMIVRSALVDSTKTYSRDFTFSVDRDALARRLSELKGTGTPVKVTYKRYWGMLPWRGANTCIVTEVEPQR
ncbi:MAG: hypothetical protein K1V87_09535 [Muribaculum sp.]